MMTGIIANPTKPLKALSLLVLLFVPLNMLLSPAFDFYHVQEQGFNWTVTLSAFILVLAASPLLALAGVFLKSRHEKLFMHCAVVFFLYAFAYIFFIADRLFYQLFGLTSALGATLVATMFYVVTKDQLITQRTVFYGLIGASVVAAMPLVLVQIDPAGFAQLADGVGASNILYGYENPRALGWASSVFLSLSAAFLAIQPKEHRIHPAIAICVVISAMTLFWSGSRGGVVACAVGLLITLGLSQTRNSKGISVVLLCVVLGAALSTLLHIPSSAFGMFTRVAQNLEADGLNSMSSGRIELWKMTIAYIMERPFTGYGYLPHKNLDGFTHGSAHNSILDAWLSFGVVIGTLLILAGIGMWIKTAAFIRAKSDPYIAALFCVMTTLCAYSLISGPYARTFPLLLFGIACGTLLGLRSKQMKPR